MTDKLPRIGARYKAIRYPEEYEVFSINIKKNIIEMLRVDSEADGEVICCAEIHRFWDNFEELPEEAISKPSDHIPDVGKKGRDRGRQGIGLDISRNGIVTPGIWKKPEQKLPEVGRSYRQIKTGEELRVKEVNLINKTDEIEFEDCSTCDIKIFWNIFEAMEDHKEEEKPFKAVQKRVGEIILDEIKKEYRPVDKALEELKKELAINRSCHFTRVEKLQDLGNKLVNALEEEKKNQPTVTFQKADQPERGFNSETWSDVKPKFYTNPAHGIKDDFEEEKKKIDMPIALPVINNYIKNFFFERNLKLPKYLSEGLERINRACWDIFEGNIKMDSKDVEELEKPMAGPTIPQTPVCGISGYTEKEENGAGDESSKINSSDQKTGDFEGKKRRGESIWKDVSELPQLEEDIQIIVNLYEGCYVLAYSEGAAQQLFEVGTGLTIDNKNIKEWCRFPDFIKHQRELEGRVEKWEKKKEVDLEKLRQAKNLVSADSRNCTFRAIELIIEILEENIK